MRKRTKLSLMLESPNGDRLQAVAARPSTESEDRQMMLRLEELAQMEGLREDRIRVKIPATTQALIDGKADDGEVLKHDGSVVLAGKLQATELSADPADPPEGQWVIWMSDGQGATGDDGDIVIKIRAGGVTKSTILVDFSTI